MFATFVASHSQSPALMPYYKRINDFLLSKDFSVFSGSLFDKKKDPLQNETHRKKWYELAMKNIKKSDIVVVEISYPSSANVGHELTFALEAGIPVVALYMVGRDPIFLRGNKDEKLSILQYDAESLETVLGDSLDYAVSQQDTRFNFFISPKIGHYLDWVAKKKRIPRAVYLRRLIDEDMKKNKDFEA